MVCAAALLLCILLFPRFAAPFVMQHRSSAKDIPVELPFRASATRDSGVVAKADSSPCPYPDEGLAYIARRNDDLLQQDSSWVALAQALDDTPGSKSHSRFEGGLDASTQSSAGACVKSDRKRRRLNPSDEETFSLKSYECRFCPMKFNKSQALGGHMNRHRQERQHEILNNAHHLVMQHRYPTLALPGQDQSSPSGLKSRRQGQMQRLHARTFEHDINMAASGVSSYKSTQYSPLASLLAAPGSGWNLDVSIGSTQNAAAIDLNRNTLSLDATMPWLQTRLPSGAPLNTSLPFMMRQPPIRFSGPDMLEMPFERNTAGLAAFRSSALNSNPYAAQTSRLQTQRQYVSGGPDRHVNVSSVWIPRRISQQNLAPLASMQPEGFHMAPHGGFHFSAQNTGPVYSYPTEGIKASTSNAMVELNAASKNLLEGEPWIFAGNQKNANEEHNHALTSDAKVMTTPYGQSRMMSSTASAMWSGANRSNGRTRVFHDAGIDFAFSTSGW